jgi:hypothetical protein
MSAFNRLLGFDPVRLMLHVEAGAAIGSIALWAAERNLSMPVLPGYPAITVGGCIAADAHCKNPLRDGTFSDWIEAVTLYHPAHGRRTLDRKTHPEEFEATCGGYGLTGLIVDATLRLVQQAGQAWSCGTLPLDPLWRRSRPSRSGPLIMTLPTAGMTERSADAPLGGASSFSDLGRGFRREINARNIGRCPPSSEQNGPSRFGTLQRGGWQMRFSGTALCGLRYKS